MSRWWWASIFSCRHVIFTNIFLHLSLAVYQWGIRHQLLIIITILRLCWHADIKAVWYDYAQLSDMWLDSTLKIRAAHLRDEITVVISLPHRRSPTLFFGGALRDIQKTAARKTMFLLACSQTLYFLLTARAKGSGWTVVFSVWACATAEQAMYMEAHHRVCLHQNLRVSKPLSRLFFSLVLGNVLVI